MTNKKVFACKRILIVGATGALGSAIAKTLSLQGAELFLAGRDASKLELIASELDATAIIIDLSKVDSFDAAIDKISALDGIVYAAGVAPLSPVKYMQEKHFSNCIQINTVSPLLLIRDLLRQKKIKTPASIVLISSLIASRGAAGYCAYAASKGALEASARCMALELASHKIRVNCLAPGMIESQMASEAGEQISEDILQAHMNLYPLGTGYPQDVADAATYLISDQSRWVTGTVLTVDGGYRAK